jgi:acyl dehydratase
MRWFEDLEIGRRRDLGSHCFTEAEIIAFARQYDPQFIHVDAEAAAAGPYGGLIASGWHTAAVWMKLMVTSLRAEAEADTTQGRRPAPGPSPGFLDLTWPNPVRPGDTIRYSATLIEKVDLKSKPNWGLVRSRCEGTNQRGETVLSFTGQALVERRG